MSKPTPIFSTATGDQRKTGAKSNKTRDEQGQNKGPCKLRLETKGRGGKAVTVLFNLPYDAEKARSLMKELQAACGCGATYKEGRIELQGDLRDRVEATFAARGEKIVRAGG